MNIGEAARACGLSAKMIRHYEAIGLVPPPPRGPSGYRRYGPVEVDRLRFVRRARDAGFAMTDIGRLLALWTDPGRPAREVRRLAADHLSQIEARVAELEAIARALSHLVNACGGGDRPECPILESLASDGPVATTRRRPPARRHH